MAEDSSFGKPPILMHNLIGFVPLRPDMEGMRNKWGRAVEYIKGLSVSEANIADNPDIKPLPDELVDLKAELMGRQSFKDAFPQPWGVDVNMVNLEQVVVFQEFINLPYVEQITERLAGVTQGERRNSRRNACTCTSTSDKYLRKTQAGVARVSEWGVKCRDPF